VGDVVGLMRSFHKIFEALIGCLNKDEARASSPLEGPPRTLISTCSIHRELEKVKVPNFFGSSYGSTTEAWLENMETIFSLRDYTSNMTVRMVVFKLKGSTLLWWKILMPQLNMEIKDVSWELFEERFWEKYLSEEFIECHLNAFNTS
jgi:hypothetical protein